MARNFEGAHDFRIDNFQVFNGQSAANPLEKLKSQIAAGAIHDSAERCDAPKCQPETRVAVQDDLYNWVVDGDGASEHPRKIKWVTGPAGSGKTAIMGSLAVRCAADGVLGATFFFASWSASAGRRRKTALVTTIAHQLVRYHLYLREEISKAIDANSDVFDKNLQVQMEVLVLGPLQNIARRPDSPGLRCAIIIDGLDECEAEQYHDSTRTSTRGIAERTNSEDQREILQVLQSASADPSFPFRIIIASRPERVFREFFDPENDATTFAKKLDLHNDYNADSDITLFLEAQFNLLRRRYNFPPSWPPPGTIQALVKNASGQFIYAATVIRLLDAGRRETPKALLEAILKTGANQGTTSTPLEQLDALYAHILNSSPDPLLSVRWIHSISKLNEGIIGRGTVPVETPYASLVHLVLQTDPESNEAEHLLGNLHSLIRIPPPSNQATTQYDFYHKTLFDFLKDPGRCVELYIPDREVIVFLWDRVNQACARGCNVGTDFAYPEAFLRFLSDLPSYIARDCAYQGVVPTRAGADWWVSLAIAHNHITAIEVTFCRIHDLCSWYRCKPACRVWSRSILRHLESATWIAPGLLWLGRSSEFQVDRFLTLAREAAWNIKTRNKS